jgi:hypothetical protein
VVLVIGIDYWELEFSSFIGLGALILIERAFTRVVLAFL